MLNIILDANYLHLQKVVLFVKIIFKLCIIIVVHVLLFTACSSRTFKTSDKLAVSVSIIPQEAFVKEVAGDLVDVVAVIPPGKSPSNYAPSPQELEKLSLSSVYFAIGVPAEQSSILPKLKDINSNIETIDMADEVKKYYPEREFSPGQRDPHIWLSPKRAAVMVEIIARELSDMDTKNGDIYLKNAQIYIEKLKKLDKEIESSFGKLEDRTFIIYHPSLGYFADDYGLTMVSIQSEGKDATPDDLQKIIDTAKMHNIKAVFYQAEIDSKQSRVLADEIGGKAVQIAPLAPDYIDNLKKIATEITCSNE